MENLTKLLQTRFGFQSFRPGQEAALKHLLAQESVLAVLPTGAGKTLIYQMYGTVTNRPVIIVSPLLSLMMDQVERMQAGGEKRVVAFNSQQNWAERQRALEQLAQYRFIFVSPESLANPDLVRQLSQINPGLFVIDEAHCISQWAVDFRPDYLGLGQHWQTLGQPQLLLLTATASPQIQTDILQKLQVHDVARVILDVDRPNIFLTEQTLATDTDKQAFLVDFFQHAAGPAIIYFSSKKMANQTAATLQEETNLNVAAYHADLDTETRFKVQHQFMDDQLQIICATSAFGMGIDKANVRVIIHYHLPQDLESYLQEIGRAGRDGKQSLALLLYTPGDETLASNLIDHSLPTEVTLSMYKQHPQQLGEQTRKLIQYYERHQVGHDQMLALFQAERKRKEAALLKVVQYVLAPSCRREQLLNNFASSLQTKPHWCCDFDQPDWTVAALKLAAPQRRKPILTKDWHQIINELFEVDGNML
ncbi:RecQ family ATP-dependent DNA helicase [Fructilactobacillus carniphilus]|uniref:RecQ family ATP-dependent DNA helicase n=1 Tax=Fructilactobacillus carniphilus TaxID=2940297 RepID=A0ABY5BX20_9LACO|nr:RecQ family ATP-dependent DNA helicase [Fructilactobacillus carniphilus]USS91054.1 RecQ family ATP-dependent DNA helicase [Fructilactobacillus carniphilus]